MGIELLPEPITTIEPESVMGPDAQLADAGADAATGMGTGAAGDPCLAACHNTNGSAQCVAGMCQLSCSAGFADCDRDGRNGCETNLARDPLHCGMCAHACDANRELCAEGVCEVSPCPPGRAECDDDPALLCETDLTRSNESCGFCGNSCAPAHALGGCQERRCTISSCDPGYADCDADAQSGCETPLDTPEHCGACDRSCPGIEGGSAVCNAGTCGLSCTLAGTYALRVTLPTSWPGTLLVSSGSGQFTFWGLLELTQRGSALTGALTTCGERVPDFRAAPLINERYGLTFPDAQFDRASAQPGVAAAGTLFGTAPGSRVTFARTAFMIGARLNDPVNDAWPAAGALGTVDADGDGKPGVSYAYKTGLGYSPPPANSVGSVRAQTGYIASRVVFSLDGVLDSCVRSSGSVLAQDVDCHTLGCRVLPDLRDCLSLEANHLDENAPDFMPNGGSYTLLKLANPSCAAARAALP